jgi:hypothetical protein
MSDIRRRLTFSANGMLRRKFQYCEEVGETTSSRRKVHRSRHHPPPRADGRSSLGLRHRPVCLNSSYVESEAPLIPRPVVVRQTNRAQTAFVLTSRSHRQIAGGAHASRLAILVGVVPNERRDAPGYLAPGVGQDDRLASARRMAAIASQETAATTHSLPPPN